MDFTRFGTIKKTLLYKRRIWACHVDSRTLEDWLGALRTFYNLSMTVKYFPAHRTSYNTILLAPPDRRWTAAFKFENEINVRFAEPGKTKRSLTNLRMSGLIQEVCSNIHAFWWVHRVSNVKLHVVLKSIKIQLLAAIGKYGGTTSQYQAKGEFNTISGLKYDQLHDIFLLFTSHKIIEMLGRSWFDNGGEEETRRQ